MLGTEWTLESEGTAVGMILAAYLVGTIPFGIWVSKTLRGVDPRQEGSRNIGATNVLRVAGKKEAFLTLLGDFSKGFIPVYIAILLNRTEGLVLWVGLAVILGHIFPCFLKWRGGKGVATSFGVFLAVAPSIALIALLIWIGGAYFGGASSIGALAAFGALPFLSLLIHPEPTFVAFSFMISVLVYIRHRENIQRLFTGTEGRIQKR